MEAEPIGPRPAFELHPNPMPQTGNSEIGTKDQSAPSIAYYYILIILSSIECLLVLLGILVFYLMSGPGSGLTEGIYGGMVLIFIAAPLTLIYLITEVLTIVAIIKEGQFNNFFKFFLISLVLFFGFFMILIFSIIMKNKHTCKTTSA